MFNSKKKKIMETNLVMNLSILIPRKIKILIVIYF